MVGSAITTTTPESSNSTGTRRLVRKSQSDKVSVTPFLVLRTSQIFWQFNVQTVATSMNVTRGVHRTPLRTHTRALFLTVHARTPDVVARLGQGLGDLFVCLKSHSIIGHVFVECSFDPVSSYFLITYCLTDTTYCLSYATDGSQSETPVLLRSGVDSLATRSIRLQTQVMSPSSASMSIASTRRSTFRPETCVSRKRKTRQSPLPRTLIYLHILLRHSGASSRSQHSAASRVPTVLKLGSLGSLFNSSKEGEIETKTL